MSRQFLVISSTGDGEPVKRALWDMEIGDGELDKVSDFLSGFSETDRLTFASQQMFWQDFLSDKITPEAFREFFSETNDGIIDFKDAKTSGRTLRDTLTAPFATYLNNNSFIGHVYTEEEMLAKWHSDLTQNQMAIHSENIEPPTEIITEQNDSTAQGEVRNTSAQTEGIDYSELHKYFYRRFIERLLASCGFVRAHRSYVVNLRFVERLNDYEMFLTNGMRISVPRKRYAGVKELFNHYKNS